MGALGIYDGKIITLEMVQRFSNGPIEACGHCYWDVLGLFQNLKDGLAKAAQMQRRDILSAGVDSCGVDFALLDRQDKLVGNSYCSRDPQIRGIYDRIYPCLSKQEMFQATDIQSMEIISLCQLMAMKLNQDPAYECAGSYLQIADLMHYWLSGEKRCEYTNASTSQLLYVHTRDWSETVLNAMGFPVSLFPKIAQPGELIGRLLPVIAEEIGLRNISIIATATHDTAAAVLAVPSNGELVPGDCWGVSCSSRWSMKKYWNITLAMRAAHSIPLLS
jgi:sugar (pentulose or hexulose) kinase